MYPQVFGKYVLERELSRGGMARVLLATLRGAGGFEKKLVVKQIRDELAYDQQFVRRFVEEAKTTVALSHPNIVPVYELGQEQGTYYLAMELVEGLSIAELLRERRADGSRRVLTPEEGAYVGLEVCRALDYAHRRMKVVHRDITPRNVMLDEEGQVKLIDFGIAAPARVAGHEILGSPGHMPPEQVEGEELGPATDIFALAVLLMEAWTGAAPFRRATPEECDAAMRAKHPRPSDFDPRLAPLDAAIGRAMKLDPRARQKDAAELGRELRSFLAGVDPSDVARTLGDRVRDAREAASSPSPRARGGPDSAAGGDGERARMASAGDLGTKTFAAREDVSWTGSSVPTETPSTREIDDVKVDPALSIPTPLMVQTSGELPSAAPTVRTRRAQGSSGPPDGGGGAPRRGELETIATRPLETPVARRTVRPPARSRAWLGILVGGVAIAAGGAYVWRAKSSGSIATAMPSSAAAPAPPSASLVVASLAPSALAPPPSTAKQAPAPTASAVGPNAQLAASAVERSGKAVVSLVGDPGTRVSVDGVSRGACPVKLALDPGQHEARFTFEPTGESRGERISVRSGEKVTVRAEFTGATPTVRIYR